MHGLVAWHLETYMMQSGIQAHKGLGEYCLLDFFIYREIESAHAALVPDQQMRRTKKDKCDFDGDVGDTHTDDLVLPSMLQRGEYANILRVEIRKETMTVKQNQFIIYSNGARISLTLLISSLSYIV